MPSQVATCLRFARQLSTEPAKVLPVSVPKYGLELANTPYLRFVAPALPCALFLQQCPPRRDQQGAAFRPGGY